MVIAVTDGDVAVMRTLIELLRTAKVDCSVPIAMLERWIAEAERPAVEEVGGYVFDVGR